MVTLTRGALGSWVCCTAAGNDIGDAGATALAAALEKNTSVTSVDLGCARAWLGGRGGWMGGSGALGHAAAPAALARSDAERKDASALRCARAPFEW